MNILVKNANRNGEIVNLTVKNGIITGITKAGSPCPADRSVPPSSEKDISLDRIIDARGKILIPSMKNGHTHAAMTLLRGYADDMELKSWLETMIWPAEARFTSLDIYWGTRLAALEMIKSGTTFCNDMYFHLGESRRAFYDSGMKAAAGQALFDFFDPVQRKEQISSTLESWELYGGEEGLVQYTISPHAIYTVSPELLIWGAEFSREKGIPYHIHLSETAHEINECINSHGKRPVEYLADLGVLGPDLVAAHANWFSDEEMDLFAEAGATVVHNPSSNMKLASGTFPYKKMLQRKIPMLLGTDGCSSNNNLDMFEEMKISALLHKHSGKDPTTAKAEEMFALASGAYALGAPGRGVFKNISGTLAEGEPADLLLLDQNNPRLVPSHNLISNLVYSAGGFCVDTVICAGNVLMEGGKVPGEEEVILHARERAALIHG